MHKAKKDQKSSPWGAPSEEKLQGQKGPKVAKGEHGEKKWIVDKADMSQEALPEGGYQVLQVGLSVIHSMVDEMGKANLLARFCWEP